jgi:very-short-patch-repair endonuclease
MAQRIPTRLTENARVLRREATPEERLLWVHLSAMRPRFTRQLVIGNSIADFACRSLKLVVELDGSQHVENIRDAKRTATLEAAGWQVMRFWNGEVRENVEGVVVKIGEAIKQLGGKVAFVGPRRRRGEVGA